MGHFVLLMLMKITKRFLIAYYSCWFYVITLFLCTGLFFLIGAKVAYAYYEPVADIVVLNSSEFTAIVIDKPLYNKDNIIVLGSENKAPDIPVKIRNYVYSYRGARIDKNYLKLLWESCNYDEETLKKVIAVSVIETGMGRDTKKSSNFWGYFKGSRDYDPSREEMAMVICRAFNGTYRSIIESRSSQDKYVGSIDAEQWRRDLVFVYNKMK